MRKAPRYESDDGADGGGTDRTKLHKMQTPRRTESSYAASKLKGIEFNRSGSLPAALNKLVIKIIVVVGAVTAIGVACALLFVAPRWPFRESQFKRRIESATGTHAQIGKFHQFFLPHPGCVAEDVVLTPEQPDHPKIEFTKLGVTGLYWGLIGKEKHLRSITVDGLQVEFPAQGGGQQKAEQEMHQSDPKFGGIHFDQVEANGSKLIFESANKSTPPKFFEIYRLVLKGFSPRQAMHFNSVLKIPEPPANVQVSGLFGPLQKDVGKIALSGSFGMKEADLSKYKAIAGKVAAQGNFKGTLENLQVQGTTETPDFTATHSGHSLHLQTEFRATVNGTNGDVSFEPIHAKLADTSLVAQGEIAEIPDKPDKALNLDISSDSARIQDLMYLFVQSKPPLQGATQFQAKVRLPFDKRQFVERVEMKAHFGIRGSKFTHSDTQQKVSQLSESARGNPNDEDPPMVVTDLFGDVTLENATAKFSKLALRVPGAYAVLHGTYNLESEKIDLHGTLRTDVKLSKATTGFKAFLMKVVEFAKKKKKEGATVPVKITGTYDKPSFELDAPAEK